MRAFLFLILYMLFSSLSFGEEIHFLYMAQSGYQPPDVLQRAEEFYEKTGIKVKVSFPEYEDRYNMIVASVKDETPEYDVILMDLIWGMDFIQKGYLDPLPKIMEKNVEEGIIPEIYSAFRYKNRLWAVPFEADFQLLYINMDIMEKAEFSSPPQTLQELVIMAKTIKEKGILMYPLFDSWNKQEALICEFTWLTGAFGGDLNIRGGRINIFTPPAVKALTFMVNLLKTGIMNPYSLHADEILASQVFLSEDCAFTTNWTFLIELARKTGMPIKDHWIPALIPVSKEIMNSVKTRTSSISGYEGLGVPSNSRHKESAWAFIRFLASPEFQQQHLDYMSVWKDVWQKEITKRTDPYIELKEIQIKGVHNRPFVSDYKIISDIIQKWLYKALLLETEPEEALKNAQSEIEALQ